MMTLLGEIITYLLWISWCITSPFWRWSSVTSSWSLKSFCSNAAIFSDPGALPPAPLVKLNIGKRNCLWTLSKGWLLLLVYYYFIIYYYIFSLSLLVITNRWCKANISWPYLMTINNFNFNGLFPCIKINDNPCLQHLSAPFKILRVSCNIFNQSLSCQNKIYGWWYYQDLHLKYFTRSMVWMKIRKSCEIHLHDPWMQNIKITGQ